MLGSVFFCSRSDNWIWDLGNGVDFTVKDTRHLIDDFTLPHGSRPTTWNTFIHIKINIFHWRYMFNRLLTKDNPIA